MFTHLLTMLAVSFCHSRKFLAGIQCRYPSERKEKNKPWILD